MNTIEVDEQNPKIQKALTELKHLIQQRWPDASFITERGFDPEGIYLIATIDVQDTVEVMEAIVERLVDFQVEEGLPVYVNVVRPQHFQAHHG
jgi:hypothetical protein